MVVSGLRGVAGGGQGCGAACHEHAGATMPASRLPAAFRCLALPPRPLHSSVTSTESWSFLSSDCSSVVSVLSVLDSEAACRTQSLSLRGSGSHGPEKGLNQFREKSPPKVSFTDFQLPLRSLGWCFRLRRSMLWRDNGIQRVSGGDGGGRDTAPPGAGSGLRGPEGRWGAGGEGERHSKQGPGSPSLAKSGQAAQGPRAEE